MEYLLIWDIDGTLIQGGGIGKSSLNEAFHQMFGVKDGFEKINMAGMVDSVFIERVFRANEISLRDKDRFLVEYCRILEKEISALSRPLAAPGILDLFGELEPLGLFSNALGTGNIERGARIKLSRDRLNKYFPTGGFGDEARERWELIRTAADNAAVHYGKSFKPERTFIIGDTPKDVECGQALGMKTIGVGTGPFSPARLKAAGADYVFEDFTDNEAFIKLFIS